MMTHARPLMATLLALVLLLGTAPRARAATSPSEGQAQAIGRTPPRLSYINGEVSLLRPGAQDWSPAQANTLWNWTRPTPPSRSITLGTTAQT